ncbi:hypothetical protein NHX12_003822 [Muraenolepis orangiensis]|uniref:Doublecortin domain-containing protein n=1 Tax=Muraenolepis orangiensis TaxID=630683 RepID=A0A9Q0DWL7_9TELE|nr:hypothetical protein NHX12_003822 [Muraenolepis orangiensis]
MSNTPVPDAPTQRVSSGSVQTLTSRPLQPLPDPSASKRVCFYRSGDPKFGGQRLVINGRNFKTFDALLDALSKTVPLPFGVRKISTPRGIHSVRGLEDLQDGGSYVCSDQRRIKPLNLDAVHRRQVRWDTTRPPSTGRRRDARRNEGSYKAAERVSVRTPRRLVVLENRDPAVKRTVVLQKRTAPTFDALLDYLSQVMQFPVLKLYSTDGRRVDGLAALILCSGIIVAAGNEPFRLANYNVHTMTYMSQPANSDAAEPLMLQSLAYNNKPLSTGRGSKNFSLSSERYMVHQINGSLNGSIHQHHHHGSLETALNGNHTSIDKETCENVGTQEPPQTRMLPQDEDIEKSFRVNQDGSMTVEMKIRLTIKEEELLHWTTTLSRSSLHHRTACVSKSGTGNSSPDSNNAMAIDSSSFHDKDQKHPAANRMSVGVSGERACESSTPTESEKPKSGFKRTPTPGPRHGRKDASVESVTTVTLSGAQESTRGWCSYTEQTAEVEVTEEYCVVRHNNTGSSSSSRRSVPKRRSAASAGATNKALNPSVRSSAVADILMVENNGVEITETVMHIYERQGGYDNLAKNEYMYEDIQGNRSTKTPRSKPASTESRLNQGSADCDVDCDVDLMRPSSATDTMRRPKEQQTTSRHNKSPKRIPAEADERGKHNITRGVQKKKAINPTGKKKSFRSSSNSEVKQKDSSTKTTNGSSGEKLCDRHVGQNNGRSSDSVEEGQKKGKETALLQNAKKGGRADTTSSKKHAGPPNIDRIYGPSTKIEVKTRERTPRGNGSNINIPKKETARPPLRKNVLNIVLPNKRGTNKQKSSREKITSPKQPVESSESVSMPVLNPSPAEVHRYVEKWLQTQMSPDSVPYTEEAAVEEPEAPTTVAFQTGGDSDSEAMNECQTNTSRHHLLHNLTPRSCLPDPIRQEGPTTDNPERGDPAEQETTMKLHRCCEAIDPAENEPSSSTNHLLAPQATLKLVLQQLCATVQCIRMASEPESPGHIEKSKSLPDFSTQVASVFGSPAKALLSFLSAMALRETLKGAVAGESHGSRNTSEAMLVMESLQKISTIQDEVLQQTSLTDLQDRISSELKDCWTDFQALRQLSMKFSEQVVLEAGDIFADQNLGMKDVMEELNMPQDLREEISSTFEQMKSLYPEVEGGTFLEKEINHSETDKALEQFPQKHDNETKQEPDSEEKENSHVPGEELNGLTETQSLCEEQNDLLSDSKQEVGQGMEEAGETHTREHGEQSMPFENHPEPGLVNDECGSEISGNTKKEKVEQASTLDGPEARLTELEDEVIGDKEKDGDIEFSGIDGEQEAAHNEHGEEELDEDIEKQETLQKAEEEKLGETPEVGSTSMSEERGREEVGEEKVEDDSSEGMGFTDKDLEVDEGENEKPNVVEETEAEFAEDALKEGGTIQQEVAGEEDKIGEQFIDGEVENIGESTEEQGDGEGDADEEEKEEEKDNEDTVDLEAEQEAEGEHTSDEANEVREKTLDLGVRVEETELNDREDEKIGKLVIANADVSAMHTCALAQDWYSQPQGICEEDHDNDDREKGSQMSHPVEISQGLIDFVNTALQSSSLICTYNTRGNVRIEPNNAKALHTKEMELPEGKEGGLYGLKRLPSPSTSDLSDYRPETSESGGYKSQESIDIVTESEDENHGNVSPEHEDCMNSAELTHSSPSLKSPSEQRLGTFSSSDSGTKASKGNIGYVSAAGSLKADSEVAADVTPFNSNDGVLIDKGRWLLKENHLIRKSPPSLMGMYEDTDSSVDTAPDNTSEDSHPHSLTDQNPLAVISSSELEDMAKPHSPKCTYYNMPHGSDSDPFLDDVMSVKSSKRELSKGKGEMLPIIDTSKTYLKNNGSLSSFASVDFKMPDSRVHPEAVAQARRPPSGAGRALQAQDSADTLCMRCGQYCPIL